MRKTFTINLIALFALSLFGLSCGKGGEEPQAKSAKPGKRGAAFDRSNISYPVEVEPVKFQSLVYTVTAVGSIEAFEKVQVTARVAGVVDRVLFAEGNYASVEQVLVEIEPQRYKLAVEAAQAAQAKAEAAKADAEAGLKRREAVATQTPGLIPGEELETWRTKVLLAASDMAQTKAALDQANLNLHDAYVRAPFSGIIQTRTVQTGQYVQVGTVLATLIRRDPLLLRFKVPEREASQIRVGMPASFRIREEEREYAAKIVHVDASADETTRMVSITAEVRDSQEAALRPGAFAEVVVPVSSPRMSPVVPQTAIRPSEKGFLAFVVENDTAQERIISVGMRTADGRVEVLSGLKAGEIIVVRGAEALRNGVPVRQAKTAASEPAAIPKKPS